MNLTNFIKKMIHAQPWPIYLNLPRYQSHRGFCQDGKQENTIAAFRAAQQNGFEMFECDVQLSKDQIPIVFHDSDIYRLTGRHQQVNLLSAQELKQTVNAPTLNEVLLDASLPAFINIEIKTKGTWNESLERRVVALIRQRGVESRIIFSSFNPVSIWKLSQLAPQIPRALLVSNEPSEDNPVYLQKMWLAPLLKIHMLNLDYRMITSDLMVELAQQKIPVAAWTVNGQQDAQRLFDFGVASIITDQKLI